MEPCAAYALLRGCHGADTCVLLLLHDADADARRVIRLLGELPLEELVRGRVGVGVGVGVGVRVGVRVGVGLGVRA